MKYDYAIMLSYFQDKQKMKLKMSYIKLAEDTICVYLIQVKNMILKRAPIKGENTRKFDFINITFIN